MRKIVWFVVAMYACGGNPWSVAGAPDVPPDQEFRTGVEAGDDVYVWECYKGHRVLVRQYGSACFGSRSPEKFQGPCGTPLPIETAYPGSHLDNLPDSRQWPGVPAGGLPPPDSGAPALDSGASIADAGSAIVPTTGALSKPPLSKATLEANAALDRAFAKTKSTATHTGPWVTEQSAHVDGDDKTGWRITWSHHPPAGFEYDATVSVGPNGDIKVTRAEAQFSPD